MPNLSELMQFIAPIIPLASDKAPGTIDPYVVGTGVVYAGTYNPQLTAGTNVSVALSNPVTFIRLGPAVIVIGSVLITCPTALNTSSNFLMDLPISSDIKSTTDLAGTGTRAAPSLQAPGSVLIAGETSVDKAKFTFNATASGQQALTFVFLYLVQ